jgi:homoserine dehydrogenase
MPKKDGPKSVTPELPPVVNPDGVRSVYCNNMEVTMGAMDTRLTFNEIIADQGKLSIERRAHIVTPNKHFHAMVKVLVDYAAKAQAQLDAMEKAAEAKKL